MPAEERLHALDAVRAFALLAGIALHATMSFMPDLLVLGWPIADRSPSFTLEALFYAIHIVRMSLFFLLAGFFARLALYRKGLEDFVLDRIRRIAVPMVAGYILVTPLIALTLFWAVSRNGTSVPATADRSGPPGLPLTHLWFLYYLLLFYVAALIGRQGIVALDGQERLRHFADRIVRALVNSHTAPFVLAIPPILSLYFMAGWTWTGIPTPEYGLTPKPATTVSYGTAFVFGWLLHRQTDLLGTLERRWTFYLALSVVSGTAAWLIVGAPLPFNAEVPANVKLAYAGLYGFSAWTGMFAMLGAAMKFFSRVSPVRRYLADASYWMYIVHVPVLFALQVAMMHWPLHWSVKFPLLLASTCAVLLVSYHYAVRSTFIGKWLNGRRYPRGSGREAQVGAPAT